MPRLSTSALGAVLALLSLTTATAASAASSTPSAPASSTASPGATTATAVPTSKSVTFGIEPASATKIDGRAAFQIGATPGAVASDHVALVNYSTKPLKLTLFATDALNTQQGGFTGLLATQKPTDVGAWLKVTGAGKQVTVPARSSNGPGQVIFPLKITVPAKATPGDHAGLIFAVLTTTTNQQNAANVQLDQRVGTRVFVRVTGPLDARLTLTNVQSAYRGTWNPLATGTATVTFTVTNPGNVKLGGKVNVDVVGAFGQSAPKPAPVIVPLLLPGNSMPITVEVPGVYPQFRETASLSLTAIPAQGDDEPSISGDAQSVAFSAVPWPLMITLLLLLVVVISGALWWMLRRRRAAATAVSARGARAARQPEPVGRRERS